MTDWLILFVAVVKKCVLRCKTLDTLVIKPYSMSKQQYKWKLISGLYMVNEEDKGLFCGYFNALNYRTLKKKPQNLEQRLMFFFSLLFVVIKFISTLREISTCAFFQSTPEMSILNDTCNVTTKITQKFCCQFWEPKSLIVPYFKKVYWAFYVILTKEDKTYEVSCNYDITFNFEISRESSIQKTKLMAQFISKSQLHELCCKFYFIFFLNRGIRHSLLIF